MPSWLKDAVFYEIYPQSFRDTNADGIGDIPGITEKLDYVRNLGANALWINPCFDSPFKDAGYDIRDYKTVAPRYGTNEDLEELFREAHRRGMHVLLDLVPGHTSEEHEWFRMSSRAEKNEYSGRYIWTDCWFFGIDGHPYIGGECERNGAYMLNFFKCQPALNYGWLHPTQPWQDAVDSPDALATREALKDIMRFWLDRGCDGFRVDMANSLVKDDDENKSGTQAVWRDVRAMLDRDYPEAALVSEWGVPEQAIPAGFHMDFYLDWMGNGYNSLLRDYERAGMNALAEGKKLEDRSYFKADGGGDATHFLEEYEPRLRAIEGKGYISLITCNHDTPRPAANLTRDELKLAYAMILTMPGVPFIYYGDEIGMRYQVLPTKEGGYTRTGSRTPMQWTAGKNAGFSDADEDELYLPVDRTPGAPDAENEIKDPESLYSAVKAVLRLRHAEPDLQADGSFHVLRAKKGEPSLIYRRGDLVCAVNPSGQKAEIPYEELEGLEGRRLSERLLGIGGAVTYGEGAMALAPQSFAVFRTQSV